MSLYKGNNLISGAIPNSANQSLSNLDSAGQAIIDGKADTALSNVSSIDSNSAVQTALDGKVDLDYSNADYQPVNKSGDTMTGNLIQQGGHYIQRVNLTKGTAPNAVQYGAVYLMCDKNGTAHAPNTLGLVETSVSTANVVSTYIRAIKNEANSNTSCNISCIVDASGNAYTAAPTPASNDNSTKIATTAFVKSVLSSSGNGLATISKAGKGYCKFTNGLTIQWGTGSISNSNTTIKFAVAFGSVARVCMTKCTNSDNRTEDWWIKSVSTTGFVARSSESDSCHWIAVGY